MGWCWTNDIGLLLQPGQLPMPKVSPSPRACPLSDRAMPPKRQVCWRDPLKREGGYSPMTRVM